MKKVFMIYTIVISSYLICYLPLWADTTPRQIKVLEMNKQELTDVKFVWSELLQDIYSNATFIEHYNIYRETTPNFVPDTTNGSNLIGQTAETTFTDTDALLADTNYFYYITTVTADGTESILLSPLGCKLRHDLVYTDGGTNTHWLAIPENDDYATAGDISALSPDISQVIGWDAATQTEIIWNSDSTGRDFPLQPNQPCGIIITADTVINLVGTLPAGAVDFVHNPDNFSTNWFQLPQPNIYQTASQLAADIPNLTKIGRFDPAMDTYESWFLLNDTWMGQDFSLEPGQGLLAVVTDNTTWNPSHGYPAVTASSDALEGLNELTVNLTGTADDPGGVIETLQWDFQGDGSFDFSHASDPNTSHTYNAPGTYYPTLVATDNDGFKGYAYQTVQVYGLENDITLEGFNPATGESSSFALTLSADGLITLKIYDANGNLVATPAQDMVITAGKNTLQWDGTYGSGHIVADGVYHAVLEYTVNGTTFTHDLRTTGGVDISGNIENVAVSGTLSPLEGDYVQIAYTLPEKALVSISVKNSEGDIIRHLITQGPRTAGDHTEIWDGIDDEGAAVAPGSIFLVTVNAVSLAQSAFMAAGSAPEISNVTAEPLRFSPAINPYGSQDDNRVTINFSLNKPATVVAQVYNATGDLVRTITLTDAPAGDNQISWNGRKENGILSPDGLYIIRLGATDANGISSTPFSLQSEIYY